MVRPLTQCHLVALKVTGCANLAVSVFAPTFDHRRPANGNLKVCFHFLARGLIRVLRCYQQ